VFSALSLANNGFAIYYDNGYDIGYNLIEGAYKVYSEFFSGLEVRAMYVRKDENLPSSYLLIFLKNEY